ncbi:hypothetical protein [Amycolatopsis magusensis]|uniref:hypothetical protein n=1 Tax=Amycolatopsis magusensis TaxID=882444 RepID=UPI00379C21E6
MEESGGHDDIDLGTAAGLLLDDGKTQAAALLVDAHLVADYVDTGFSMSGEDPGTDLFNVVLEVPRTQVEKFTDEILKDISTALNEVMNPQHVHVLGIQVRAQIEPASPQWRDELRKRLAPNPVNQASIGPAMTDALIEDRCAFRSLAELRVYRAFKRARDRMSGDDTLSIAPNPALVVRSSTWEPDLVIVYRGKAGVVEVDGHHHRGRRAADLSRDRLLRHSGFTEVDRLAVEDTESDEELDVFVERFLLRLGGR